MRSLSHASVWPFSTGFLSTLVFAYLAGCSPGAGDDPQALGGLGSGGDASESDASGGAASGGAASGGSSQGSGGSGGGFAGADGAGGEGGGPSDLDEMLGVCPVGTFDDDEDDETACITWSECEPGTFVARAGTASKDAGCEPCAGGTFSAPRNSSSCESCAGGTFSRPGASSCRPHRECDWDDVLVESGTPLADTVCTTGSVYRQFGTDAEDTVLGMAGGPDGGVFVAGGTLGALGEEASGDSDSFLRLYDGAGDVVWTRQFGFASADTAHQVAAGALGHPVVVGTVVDVSAAGGHRSYLRKFDGAGETTWSIDVSSDGPVLPTPFLATHLAVDRGGNSFLAGVTPRDPEGGLEAGWDVSVRKYDAEGSFSWARSAGSEAEEGIGGVAVTQDGRAFVVGFTDGDFGGPSAGGRDAFVWALESDGTEAWLHQFGTTAEESAGGVAAAGMTIQVAGTTTGSLASENAGAEDLFLRRLQIDGTVISTTQEGTGKSETLVGVTWNGVRTALLARVQAPGSGEEGADGALFVYRGGNGAPFDLSFGSDVADFPNAVAPGPAGHVFVGGSTKGALAGDSFGQGDGFVARFSIPLGM